MGLHKHIGRRLRRALEQAQPDDVIPEFMVYLTEASEKEPLAAEKTAAILTDFQNAATRLSIHITAYGTAQSGMLYSHPHDSQKSGYYRRIKGNAQAVKELLYNPYIYINYAGFQKDVFEAQDATKKNGPLRERN